MPVLDIKLDGDGTFPELREKAEQGKVIKTQSFSLTTLAGGMESGDASVAFIIDLPDGQVVFAETSKRLFLMAARLVEAKYGRD